MTRASASFHPREIWSRGLPRDEPLQGDWWKPDQPESPLHGTLTVPQFGHPQLRFEDGDELLKLVIGLFGSFHGRIWDLGNRPATILSSHGFVTRSVGPPEPKQHRTLDIDIDGVFIGRHLSSDTESVVTSASLVSPYLDEWAEFDGFSDALMPPEQRGYELKFTPQQTEHIRVSDRTSVHFGCALHRASATWRPSRLNLTQYTAASLKFTEPLPIRQVQQEIEKLTSFVNFCLRRVVDNWDVFLRCERNASGQEDSDCELVGSFSQFQGSEYDPSLVTRLELGAQLSECLKAWWSVFDQFRPAISHHLTTLGDGIPYDHMRFLNLVQGLEAFHRRFRRGVYEPRSAFKKGLYRKLAAAVSDDLSPDYRKAVLLGLLRINEYTIYDRLMEIYNSHEAIVNFGFQNSDEQIREICWMRHTITHGLKRGEELFRSKEFTNRMYSVSEHSRLLLEAAIFARLTNSRDMARNQLRGVYGPL